MACSTTGPWATSSTTTRCACPPNAYARRSRLLEQRSASANGTGLTYDTASLITMARPARQHRHQHADAGFVQVADDAQLQRVVRATHPVEPGGRGRLRRHARPRPREPHATATSCRMAHCAPALQRRRSVGAGQPRGGRERQRQPRDVPALQRAVRASRSTTTEATSDYDSMQLTLSRQTGKRLQYFVAYTLGQEPRARSAAILATSTRTTRRAPTACWSTTAGMS